MKYVIVNPEDEANNVPLGFGWNNPIEGWIFTILLSQATRFDTEEQAEKAIKDHYKNSDYLDRLIVAPVTK